MNQRLFLGVGFGIWFVVTLLFIIAGDWFFLYDNFLYMVMLHVVTYIALASISEFLFTNQDLEDTQRFQGAALLVISGMVLDTLIVQSFEDVFTNMDIAADGVLGGWLLWAYVKVLITITALIPLPISRFTN